MKLEPGPKWTQRSAAESASPEDADTAAPAGRPSVTVMAYGADDLLETSDADLAAIARMRAQSRVIWIDIVRSVDAGFLSAIGAQFGLHELALEDAVDADQRPKVEEYEDHLFIVALTPHGYGPLRTRQVAFFVGDGYLVTVREQPANCFDAVRDRLRRAKGHIRDAGSDYLCYALLDAIVDGYFPVLEQIGEALGALEDRVLATSDNRDVSDIHGLKRQLLVMRRAIWPHREVFNTLIRDEHPLIAATTRPFLRDCYDHTIQLIDIVETYREIASELVDVHISSVSVKINEVMKVLTIVATVFMPLSFIASVYGMNFDRSASPWNMPELGWYLGYPFSILLMCASAAGLIWYIWKKGWLR
ncbi:magnesium/cobalt transporter CorA [Roseibacterium sp. SDUM158017]|uniref:magnesium/cobalt transporter CorA n=1 Tax=Roseicyclus salinarum TaxID=3036773 RepID=UPI002414E68E|nr:magnesium/cobalt transporter CorA [Roseibacterium sp. SDUM158017]MDG4647852.1 magnesium/cobalt transporter CorA [Roseibacterium sp. SDUM158017]